MSVAKFRLTEALAELKSWYEAGYIFEEVYREKQRELLQEFCETSVMSAANEDSSSRASTHIDPPLSSRSQTSSLSNKQLLRGVATALQGTRVLDLCGGHVGDGGISNMAAAIRAGTCLEKIKLRDNNIGAESVKRLVEALKDNTSLTYLDLSNNNIGNEGAPYVAQLLSKNKLRKLFLGVNQIGVEGIKAISEVLSNNTSLIKLYMGGNAIGLEGTIALCDAIAFNTCLRSLYLWGAGFGSQGAKKIAELLIVNSKLTLLDIEYNCIGDEGAQAITIAVQKNSSLSALFIWGNYFSEEQVLWIERRLKVNKQNAQMYSELVTSCTVPLKKVRLVVCGHDSSGKTTLIKSLASGRLSRWLGFFSSAADTISTGPTVGAELSSLQIDGVNFNVLDIGGEPQYHTIFDRFLSQLSPVEALSDSNNATPKYLTVHLVVASLAQNRDRLRQNVFFWLSMLKNSLAAVKPNNSNNSNTNNNNNNTGATVSESRPMSNNDHSGNSNNNSTLDNSNNNNSNNNNNTAARAVPCMPQSRRSESLLGTKPIVIVTFTHADVPTAAENVGYVKAMLREVIHLFGLYLDICPQVSIVDARSPTHSHMQILKQCLYDRGSAILNSQPLLPRMCSVLLQHLPAVKAYHSYPDVPMASCEELSSILKSPMDMTLADPAVRKVLLWLTASGDLSYFDHPRLQQHIFIDPSWLYSNLLGRLLLYPKEEHPLRTSASSTSSSASFSSSPSRHGRLSVQDLTRMFGRESVAVVSQLLRDFELAYLDTSGSSSASDGASSSSSSNMTSTNPPPSTTLICPAILREGSPAAHAPPQWDKDSSFTVYVGRRYQCALSIDMFTPPFFPRLQVRLLEKYGNQCVWKGGMKIVLGHSEALVEIKLGRALDVICRSPKRTLPVSAYELLMAIEEETLNVQRDVCPGLSLSLLIPSVRCLRAHVESTFYDFSAVEQAWRWNIPVGTGLQSEPAAEMLFGNDQNLLHVSPSQQLAPAFRGVDSSKQGQSLIPSPTNVTLRNRTPSEQNSVLSTPQQGSVGGTSSWDSASEISIDRDDIRIGRMLSNASSSMVAYSATAPSNSNNIHNNTNNNTNNNVSINSNTGSSNNGSDGGSRTASRRPMPSAKGVLYEAELRHRVIVRFVPMATDTSDMTNEEIEDMQIANESVLRHEAEMIQSLQWSDRVVVMRGLTRDHYREGAPLGIALEIGTKAHFLETFRHTKEWQEMHWRKRIRFAIECAATIETMHMAQILVNDISTRSFFFEYIDDTGDPYVRIADLGCACHLGDACPSQPPIPAPEWTTSPPVPSVLSDVYLFGLFLLDMLPLSQGEEEQGSDGNAHAVVSSEEQKLSSCPAGYRRLVEECKSVSPLDRIDSMTQVRAILEDMWRSAGSC